MRNAQRDEYHGRSNHTGRDILLPSSPLLITPPCLGKVRGCAQTGPGVCLLSVVVLGEGANGVGHDVRRIVQLPCVTLVVIGLKCSSYAEPSARVLRAVRRAAPAPRCSVAAWSCSVRRALTPRVVEILISARKANFRTHIQCSRCLCAAYAHIPSGSAGEQGHTLHWNR